MKKLLFVICLLLFPLHYALSSTVIKCGNFVLSPHSDGWMYINNARPETQKITPIGKNDIKIQWIVDTDEPGRWLGMDYIKRDGKAILNVQILQASMDAPRIYGSFPCHKVG
ncbi:hypothetical protein OD635_005621 [Salmonella enterica]|nr:hypothetical protein [Salmonella enterica]